MDEQDREQQIVELEAKAEEYLAGWKRAQADYQNLKKDLERERAAFAIYANERFVRELLPVLDQLELAIRHAPTATSLLEEGRTAFEHWMDGLRAVISSWNAMASALGLERIAADGPFDPALHEAAGERAQDGKASGSIVEELCSGWKWNGKVLRPSRVIIAK